MPVVTMVILPHLQDRQFMPYLQRVKMSARTNLHFSFSYLPFALPTLYNHYFILWVHPFLPCCFSGLVGGSFLCLFFNNSFSLKISAYSSLLFLLVPLCILLYPANLSHDDMTLEILQVSWWCYRHNCTECLAELDIFTAHSTLCNGFLSSDYYYSTSVVWKEAVLWCEGQNSSPKGQRRELWSHTVQVVLTFTRRRASSCLQISQWTYICGNILYD